MDKRSKNLKTFCPLPWTHISANSKGAGRICCEGYETLETDWKESKDLKSYFNTEAYKKARRQMLNGERPEHCVHCFHQEDHGVQSIRQQFINQYESQIEGMIQNTEKDGAVLRPQITYIDMALGNKCNLKCRMCSPYASYIIGKDWKLMGQPYNEENVKKIREDKWYASPKTLQMLKEALPHIQVIFSTGGEPMLIPEHLDILRMIIREGHAHHISLRYNSNQTVIPEKIINLWQSFKSIDFNCSVEAYGKLNNYIRYPSEWEKLEKNIYFLDQLSYKNEHIEIYIHTTLQAYNIMRIPELLNWLRRADFKSLHRFPFFIWVKIPEWLCPSILPEKIRTEAVDKILESLEEHENFFLNYNRRHRDWCRQRMQSLREFCRMIKNDNHQEKHFDSFIKQTKKHDLLRKQSVLKVLPELSPFFPYP